MLEIGNSTYERPTYRRTRKRYCVATFSSHREDRDQDGLSMDACLDGVSQMVDPRSSSVVVKTVL